MNTDAIRAAIIQVVTNTISMLVLLSLLSITAEQMAAIGIFVNSLTGFIFLVWRVNPGTETKVTVETTETADVR